MEPLVGQLMLIPYNFVPKGWMACDGRTLPINQNQALFSLLGTNFGGDGRTTFGLPNLQGPAPNLQYAIAIAGVYPTRE